ncbi:hypothetical protein PFISCL1PPCAC_24091, partial [Pristionchus fissidentatus]
SSSRKESSDFRTSEKFVEGIPNAKCPRPRDTGSRNAQLKALAKSGEILNIDKTFDLFGVGSIYFRRVILIYSLLFLLIDCAWQLVIDMDRKIHV